MEDNMFDTKISLCQNYDQWGNLIYVVVDSTKGIAKGDVFTLKESVLFAGSLRECLSCFAAMTRLLEKSSQRARRRASSTRKATEGITTCSGEKAASGERAGTRKRGAKPRIGFDTGGPSRGSGLDDGGFGVTAESSSTQVGGMTA